MDQIVSALATDPHRHWNSDRNICDKGAERRGCAAGFGGGSLFITFIFPLILIVGLSTCGLVVVGNNALGPSQSVVGFQKAATGLSIRRSSLPSAGTPT